MSAGQELRLRIAVLDPPAGVTFKVQRGNADLEPPSSVSSSAIVFDLSVRVDGVTRGGHPRFLGEYTQGPPDGRFIYVNSGTLAGQADSCFTRRAKVPLAGIPEALVERAVNTPGALLEARFQGRGRDGGPACASVSLVGGGWHLVA